MKEKSHRGSIDWLVFRCWWWFWRDVTRFSQFQGGICCIWGYGVAFVAINPICNSPSLCFEHTDVGCLHGSMLEHNNTHISVPIVPMEWTAAGLVVSRAASEPADISLALSAGATKGSGEVQWMPPQGRQLAAWPLLTGPDTGPGARLWWTDCQQLTCDT